MAKKSPISATLHGAFERHFLPLLTPLGFAQAPLKARPGLVAVFAARPLDAERRVEATLWCHGGTGYGLLFHVDLVSPNGHHVDLMVPWPDPDFPNRHKLDSSGSEFRTQESPERLELGIEFLAGAFAANADALELAIPELASELGLLKLTPLFQSAIARSAELWRTRHMRGEIDPSSLLATIVFVGKNLVTVDVEGTRLTFRFDTERFDRTLPVAVSHWFSTAAGTRRALALANGPTTWRFGPRGELLTIEG